MPFSSRSTPKEEMLGPHVRMMQLAGLHHRELENLLRAGCVGEVGAGAPSSRPLLDRLLNPPGNLFQVDVEVCQHGRGDTLTFPNQAQQDVLGSHVLVVQARGLLPRQPEYPAHTIGEVVAVHPSSIAEMSRGWNRSANGITFCSAWTNKQSAAPSTSSPRSSSSKGRTRFASARCGTPPDRSCSPPAARAPSTSGGSRCHRAAPRVRGSPATGGGPRARRWSDGWAGPTASPRSQIGAGT